MKLTKTLLCASAAALMAFVSGNAQGAVIGNNLYVPLNIKGTFSYVISAGKIAKVKFTSKDILAYYGYQGYTLALGPDFEVCIISKTEVMRNLTTDGDLYVSTDEYIDTAIADSSYKYSEAGTVSVRFYSNADATLDDNYYAFLLTGNYAYGYTAGPENSSHIYTYSVKLSASNLGGWGYDDDVSGDYLPISGSASASGSGRVVD